MTAEFGYTESFKNARESSQKFDYFFLGIILATLSLGIQTNSSNQQVICKSLLILSWVFWLLSFLAGFFRQERILTMFNLETGGLLYRPKKEVFEKAAKGEQVIVKTNDEPWEPEEIKQELDRLNTVLDFSDELRKKRAKHSIIAYSVMKWSYFLGVLTYIIFKAINM